MKRFVSLVCLMMSFLFATSQVVTVSFTGATQNGSHCRFDAVNVVNITKGWNETLVYPDTVMVLHCNGALGELSANQTGIFNVFPNPFTDYTNVEFGIGESSQVGISVFGIEGIRRAYWEGHLPSGVHRVKVSLSETQMAFVVVQTEKERYVGKLLHLGHGSKNRIELEASSLMTKQAHLEHLDAEGDFELGDVMSYEGVIVNGGNMVLSNKVIQAQYVDETISLVFPLNLPAVTTTNITDITQTTATGGGDVTDNGGLTIVERGICWSTSHNPTTSGSHASNGTSMGSYTCNMTGLAAGTTYYVRAYAINGAGTTYGGEVSFTTLQNVAMPTVTTTTVTNITQTTATGGGNVTNAGGTMVTERGICWSTSHNPTISGSHANNGTGTGEFTVGMTGLAPNATYYVRAYATNSAGTAYGSEVSFTTLQNVTLPTVTTKQVTNIQQTTVRGGGNVTSAGGGTVTARGVCWSISHNPTVSGSHTTNGSGTGNFISSMTGLTANTTYYVRAYATNSAGTAYGSEVSFTTLQNVTLPTVTTSGVTNIAQTTATGGGNVTSAGGGTVTAKGICWSTSHNPTVSGSHTANGTGTGSFTSSMTGLTANTTYYVRAYATNSAGTAYGSEVSFITLQVTLPSVTTSQVTNIQQTTASGGGNVTSAGGGTVTARGVCWSTSQNPTINNSHTNNGTGTGSFTSSMTGLSPNTTYYVRAYATNSAGTAYGVQRSFTTLQNVTLPTVTTSQVTDIAQTTATGGGNVTNAGGDTVTAKGICWSTSHNPTVSGSHTTDGTGTGGFSSSMTGLSPNTTYYVRAYATNSAGTAYGSEETFTTLQNVTLPTVTTSQVTDIAQTTATGGGNVTNAGGGTVTARGICWSTSYNPTVSGSHTTDGTGTGSFTSSMTGLTANTTYYVRAYATNSAGTAYGSEETFTTLQNVTLPTVTTNQVTNIAQTTATGGGNVTNAGGGTVLARGICWSTSHNPTVSGSCTSNGTGTGSFTCSMTGLTANTTYYVRAFALNSAGTAYGSEVNFTTHSGGGAPTGAINGLFSVSATQQVYFSQGNLQYRASTNTWRFAEHQYDYVGDATLGNVYVYYVGKCRNDSISPTYSGWIDLFGWGTSGYHDSSDPYNVNYQPWSTSIAMVNHVYNEHGYGPSTNMASPNLTGSSANYDWGVYNPISNGGNQTNQWRTLTINEWGYVFNTRTTASGIRYAKARVNNVSGVILLPDDWSTSYYSLNSTNTSTARYSSNNISATQWSALEQHGAVFLPAAGHRSGTTVSEVGDVGRYYSASYNTSSCAYVVDFDGSGLNIQNPQIGYLRFGGQSVRLVAPFEN